MNTNEVLGELNQAMSTLNDNIPEPIKQGFFRAIGRLGSAALDIPTAKLEGFAQEIRATNESRLNIIKSVGENIGQNIETPKEYSDFAVRNYSKKISELRLVQSKHKYCERFLPF
ncbi:MAG: hypothetical protein EOO93_02495 [Pedobacter sp.]|nr:MAG: hypothetical protein EOO93_02495 [Pedobacter sp.]